jgi:hypothetical protein
MIMNVDNNLDHTGLLFFCFKTFIFIMIILFAFRGVCVLVSVLSELQSDNRIE